jgi:hypothetical protein
MPATIGGAVRDAVVGWGGVGLRVWADSAPVNCQYPYVTFNDAVTVAPDLIGDTAIMAWRRTVQVDLWQNSTQEDPALFTGLVAALDTSIADPSRGVVYRCRVSDTQRIPEPSADTTHHAITLTVKHAPSVL